MKGVFDLNSRTLDRRQRRRTRPCYKAILAFSRCRLIVWQSWMQDGVRENDAFLTSTAVVSCFPSVRRISYAWVGRGTRVHETWGLHDKARCLRVSHHLTALLSNAHARRVISSRLDRRAFLLVRKRKTCCLQVNLLYAQWEPRSVSRQDRAHGNIDHLCTHLHLHKITWWRSTLIRIRMPDASMHDVVRPSCHTMFTSHRVRSCESELLDSCVIAQVVYGH